MEDTVKFSGDDEAKAILLMGWLRYCGYPEGKGVFEQLKWHAVWCKEPLHERMFMNMCAGFDPEVRTYFDEFLRINLESPDALLSK
jgi:hypothetical protein